MNKIKLRPGIVALLLLSLAPVLFSACGSKTEDSAAPAPTPAAEETVAAVPAEVPAAAESDAEKADRLLSEGQYEEAYALLRELGREDDVSASRYERGVRFFEEGDLSSAEVMFEGIDYEGSERYLSLIRAYGALSEAKSGDTVCFGSYEQDGSEDNGKEPVEWVVLDKRDDSLLLLSVYALDCVDYESPRTLTTWEESAVRGWLNSDFFDSAFSDTEKDLIACVDTRSEEYASADDNADSDRVFLLSVTEAERYLSGDRAKVCFCTEYARQNGSWHTPENICRWWLRSDGSYGNRKAGVRHQGSVYYGGFYVDIGYMSVRPAVCISLPD